MLATGYIKPEKENLDMNLTKEEIAFIKELSHEMKTQDNRGTAQPYCLMLQEEVERPVPDDMGSNVLIRWNDESYYNHSFKELKEEMLEYYENNSEILASVKKSDSFLNLIRNMRFRLSSPDFYTVDYNTDHEVVSNSANFFLTEKAYNEHIKANKHNLKNPRSYGIHLFRNWEMEELFKIIHKLAESL